MKRLLAAMLIVAMAASVTGRAAQAAPSHGNKPLTGIQALVVRTALKNVGAPYVFRNSGKPDASPATGFSDVGFVDYVYHQAHISLPYMLSDLVNSGPRLKQRQLQPGDLVFFKNTVWAGISQVGIYLGNGTFIQAEWFNIGVRVTSFRHDMRDANYWQAHFAIGVRAWKSHK